MNQYITLLFSLLADFFAIQDPTAPARETDLRVRPRAPEPGAREEQGHACQDDQVFLIVPLTRFPRLARLEAGDCSSGSPEPERRMARRTSSGPVARGPVLRERSLSENRTPTKAVFRADRSIARDRPSPYGKRHAFFHRSAGACPPRSHP